MRLCCVLSFLAPQDNRSLLSRNIVVATQPSLPSTSLRWIFDVHLARPPRSTRLLRVLLLRCPGRGSHPFRAVRRESHRLRAGRELRVARFTPGVFSRGGVLDVRLGEEVVDRGFVGFGFCWVRIVELCVDVARSTAVEEEDFVESQRAEPWWENKPGGELFGESGSHPLLLVHDPRRWDGAGGRRGGRRFWEHALGWFIVDVLRFHLWLLVGGLFHVCGGSRSQGDATARSKSRYASGFCDLSEFFGFWGRHR